MPVEHLSARRPPTSDVNREHVVDAGLGHGVEPLFGGESRGACYASRLVSSHGIASVSEGAPPLPSGWEREDDYEDGRHRYRTEPTDAMFDSIHVAWWPTSGSVVISGWLCATEPLDALLAYLRALTPEQVTAQPSRSGASS